MDKSVRCASQAIKFIAKILHRPLKVVTSTYTGSGDAAECTAKVNMRFDMQSILVGVSFITSLRIIEIIIIKTSISTAFALLIAEEDLPPCLCFISP